MGNSQNTNFEAPHSVAKSGLFDPEYYEKKAEFDPAEALDHFLANPHRIDLNPHPLFDNLFYAFHCPEFTPGKEAALVHYLKQGAAQGRSPHPLFSGEFYRHHFKFTDRVPENPLGHFLEHALANPELDPHPLFDVSFYLEQIPSLQESGENPLLHYLRTRGEAAEPNRFFDSEYYLSQIPLGIPERTPLEHWVLNGHHKPHREPNRLFVTPYVCQHNPEVNQRGINPLEFYLTTGRHLGRHVSHQITGLLIKEAGIADGRMTPENYRKERLAVFLFDGVGEEIPQPLRDRLNEEWETSELFLFLPAKDVRSLPPPWNSRAIRMDFFHLDQRTEAELATLVTALESPHKPLSLVSDRPEALRRHTNRKVFSAEEYAGEGAGAPTPSEADSGSRGTVIIPVYDWNLSGVNRVNEILALSLKARGWRVEFLVTNRYFFFDGFPKHLPPVPLRFLDAPHEWSDAWWAQARDLLESLAPAVMITGYDFRCNSFVTAVSDRIAVVGIFHSDDPDYFVQAGNLGRYFDQVVTVSEYLRAELAASHPEFASRIIAIPNGIENPGLPPPPAPKEGEPIHLIYTGRVVHYQKRVFDFVPLVEEMERRGIDYRLTIAGDGEDCRELERLLGPQIEHGNVVVTGRVSKEAISAHLARNQVFVLLSDFEGLPVSLIEAIGQGCVPLVPEIDSGIPEIVVDGETGWVISGHDLSRYVDRIEAMQKDPELWRRLSRNARALFERQYTAEIFADRYESLIESLLDKIQRGGLAASRAESQPKRSLWVGRGWNGLPAG